MPFASRKREWHKQLRQTSAIRTLQQCRPEAFPLTEVQSLTQSLLEPRAPLSLLGKKATPPQSKAADDVLLGELLPLKDQFYIYEAAVVGCLHLFTYEFARGFLCNRIRPDVGTAKEDALFTSRVSVFLQSVVIAHRADARLIHEGEATASRELLNIVHWGGRRKKLPSVMKLLSAITDNYCEELLPIEFLAEVLRRANYKSNLDATLTALRNSQEWWEAYQLVQGLPDLTQRQNLPQAIRRWLPDIFDKYPMWASWQPNIRRIEAWDSSIGSPDQKAQLRPVFDLEGPDSSPQQRAIFRFSGEGAFAGSRAQGTYQARDILDVLLDLLDRAVSIGPHSIDLFIGLCLSRPSSSPYLTIRWQTLIQVSAALEPYQDIISRTLHAFLHALSPATDIRTRMLTFTSAIPLLQISPGIQSTFGAAYDVSLRGPKALLDAQHHFCALLLQGQLGEAEVLGLEVRALGYALVNATWLYERWTPGFLGMLRAMPGEDDLRARFSAIQRREGDAQQQMDYLAVALGGRRLVGRYSMAGLTRPAANAPEAQLRAHEPPPPVVIEDPIWRDSTVLDSDRAALRKALRTVPRLDPGLATSCLKTAVRSEYDAFVREITVLLIAAEDSSDQTVVNLAGLLVRRAAAAPSRGAGSGVADCWRTLLLHMISTRPEGLLDRLAVALSLPSWNSWIENLKQLYGMGDGRWLAGLDMQRVAQITMWKIGLGQAQHRRTASTVHEVVE